MPVVAYGLDDVEDKTNLSPRSNDEPFSGIPRLKLTDLESHELRIATLSKPQRKCFSHRASLTPNGLLEVALPTPEEKTRSIGTFSDERPVSRGGQLGRGLSWFLRTHRTFFV